MSYGLGPSLQWPQTTDKDRVQYDRLELEWWPRSNGKPTTSTWYDVVMFRLTLLGASTINFNSDTRYLWLTISTSGFPAIFGVSRQIISTCKHTSDESSQLFSRHDQYLQPLQIFPRQVNSPKTPTIDAKPPPLCVGNVRGGSDRRQKGTTIPKRHGSKSSYYDLED